MGTILASAIIADAAEILQDLANVRWPQLKLLAWISAGEREVVILKPSAYTLNTTVQLVAGTKQTIPAGGVLFQDMTRNMGADGATPGRVPRFIKREVIDAENPNWHTDRASATIQHFTYEARDPDHYYVYPKQPTTLMGYAEIVYSAAPAALPNVNTAIHLNDIYANALLNYVCFRALSKDPPTMNKAGEYYQAFMLQIMGKSKADDSAQADQQSEA